MHYARVCAPRLTLTRRIPFGIVKGRIIKGTGNRE